MDIQDLGAIGELIGGVAVVASVIYLTIQIRHGVAGYQSQVSVEITNYFSNLQLQIASSDDLLNAWLKAERQEALTEIEQRRIINIVSSFFIGFENMFIQAQKGTMDKESYEARRKVVAAMMHFTGVKAW